MGDGERGEMPARVHRQVCRGSDPRYASSLCRSAPPLTTAAVALHRLLLLRASCRVEGR